jgi:hypothetical protein
MFLIAFATGILTPIQTVLGLLLFLTTPEFVRSDMAHGFQISARKPGLFVCTLGVFSFWMYHTANQEIWVLVSIAFGIMVFLMSKFSVQAYTIIFLSIALFADPLAVPVFGIAFIGAVILSFGEYIYVFTAHVRHLSRYATWWQYVFLDPPNTPVDVVQKMRKSDSRLDILRVMRETVWIRSIGNNPFIVYVIALLVVQHFDVVSLQIDPFLRVWIGAGLFAWIVTSLPHLRFLGESDRYLEYIFFPSAIVILSAWQQTGSMFLYILFAVMLTGAVVVGAHFSIFTFRLSESRHNPEWVVFKEQLDDLEAGVLIVQPYSKAREIAYDTDHDTVDFILNQGEAEFKKEQISSDHPAYVTDDVEILSEYNPDWVVFTSADIPHGLQPPDSQPVISRGHYRVYPFRDFR